MKEIKDYLELNKINYNIFTSSTTLFVYLYPETNLIIYPKLNKFYIQFRNNNKVKTFKTCQEVIQYLEKIIKEGLSNLYI